MTKRTERSPQHDKNKMPRPPKIPVKRRLLPEDETDISTKKYSTKKQNMTEVVICPACDEVYV